VQALGNAFNKKFGLNIKINYSPSSNMTGDVAKLVMGAASRPPRNGTSCWSRMRTTPPCGPRKLHLPFDYAKLGVAPELIQYDNGAVSVGNQFVLRPTTETFCPRKKRRNAGKIFSTQNGKAASSAFRPRPIICSRLAVGPWGENKTLDFVKASPNRILFWDRWQIFTPDFSWVKFKWL